MERMRKIDASLNWQNQQRKKPDPAMFAVTLFLWLTIIGMIASIVMLAINK